MFNFIVVVAVVGVDGLDLLVDDVDIAVTTVSITNNDSDGDSESNVGVDVNVHMDEKLLSLQ